MYGHIPLTENSFKTNRVDSNDEVGLLLVNFQVLTVCSIPYENL